MAAIDKIYMSDEEGGEYWNWMKDHVEICEIMTSHSLTSSFYKRKTGWVANYPESVDWYLWNNCSLPFIQERLHEQWDEQPKNEFVEKIEEFLLLVGGAKKLNEIIDFCDDNRWEINHYLWGKEGVEK